MKVFKPSISGQEIRQQFGHVSARRVLPGHHSVRRKLQTQVQRQFGQGKRSLRRNRLVRFQKFM